MTVVNNVPLTENHNSIRQRSGSGFVLQLLS
jgi:hypothetical protein